MSHVTHMNATHMNLCTLKATRQTPSYGVATSGRLLKIIGLFGRISSLLQGFFAKEPLLQKRHIILRSLLIVATP